MRTWKARIAASAMAMGLAACASDPGRGGDTALRPADRPECQVSSSTDGVPRGEAGSSASHTRCHPGESLEWSSGQGRDTIKPDFSGKKDD